MAADAMATSRGEAVTCEHSMMESFMAEPSTLLPL
jgi:hypothetical protein